MIFNIHESGKVAIDELLEKSPKQDTSFRIYVRRVSG